MAAELVIDSSTATLVLEVGQTSVLEIGAAIANGVASVILRTSSGAEFALSVDEEGLLTTTRL